MEGIVHISNRFSILLGYLFHNFLIGIYVSSLYDILLSPLRLHTFITRKLTYLSITLTILDSIIVSRIVWHQFAEGWGIEEIFIKQTVVGRTPPVFIGLIALIAQCFFAWRNWRDNSYHSKRFHTAVSITIALLSVIQCTGALATVAFDIGFPPLAHTTLAYRTSMGIWLTASLLCNFAINFTSRTKASKQYEWLFGLALSVVHFAMYYKWQAQNWYIAFSYALFGGYVNLLAITLIRETRPNSDLPVANPYPRDTRPPLHLSAGAEESFRLKNLRQGSKVPMIEIIKNVEVTPEHRNRNRDSSVSLTFVTPDEVESE